MPVHLAPFDPSRAFKAIVFMRCDGLIYSRGEPFPKAGAPAPGTLLLERLYKAHKIGYADEVKVKAGEKVRANTGKPTPEIKAKYDAIAEERAIDDLQSAHTKSELLAIVEELEAGGASLDVKKTDNKTKIATAIVKARNGTS